MTWYACGHLGGNNSVAAVSPFRVRFRLDQLSNRLGDAEWLDGVFSAGDLLMVTVLRRLDASGQLQAYPNILACIARGEARPAYKRAFADQLAVFTKSQAAGLWQRLLWQDALLLGILGGVRELT